MTWSVEQSWRRAEGDRIRKSPGHEGDVDPDWSLPEISRDCDEYVRLFQAQVPVYDGERIDSLFDGWTPTVWTSRLSVAARGLLLSRVHQARQHGLPVEVPLRTSPRNPGEGTEPYLRRLARLNGYRIFTGIRSMPSAAVVEVPEQEQV